MFIDGVATWSKINYRCPIHHLRPVCTAVGTTRTRPKTRRWRTIGRSPRAWLVAAVILGGPLRVGRCLRAVGDLGGAATALVYPTRLGPDPHHTAGADDGVNRPRPPTFTAGTRTESSSDDSTSSSSETVGPRDDSRRSRVGLCARVVRARAGCDQGRRLRLVDRRPGEGRRRHRADRAGERPARDGLRADAR